MPNGSINQYAGRQLAQTEDEEMARRAKEQVLQQLAAEMGGMMAERVRPEPPMGAPAETAVELPVANRDPGAPPETLEERLMRLRGGM